jgi:hypothetical protein
VEIIYDKITGNGKGEKTSPPLYVIRSPNWFRALKIIFLKLFLNCSIIGTQDDFFTS